MKYLNAISRLGPCGPGGHADPEGRNIRPGRRSVLAALMVCLSVGFSGGCSSTPPILDGQGKVVEGSIASLECVPN